MSRLVHRLWFRLLAAFVLVALAGVVVVALLANAATEDSFRRYLAANQSEAWQNVEMSLAQLYAQQLTWDGAGAILAAAAGSGRGPGSTQLTLLDEQGLVIATSGHRGQGQRNAFGIELPIMVNDAQVGLLRVTGGGAGAGRAAEGFLAEVNRAIWLGGAVALLLALAFGGWLARRLARPLHEMTLASERMAAGDLGQQVPIRDRGEIGELANSFNRMAGNLAEAEQQRRQLLADVAHELRTPLSVLRGQLEAMLDGVFPLTIENVAVAHEETLLLGRLIEDLRTLSLAEAGQLPLDRRLVNSSDAIQRAATAFAPLYESEGVDLVTNIAPGVSPIWADPERLQQVLSNLLANALRYAPLGTHSAASAYLTVKESPEGSVFTVRDTGPGLSHEAQQHVFDRFWRGDRSRNRLEGGSGLGLAICRAIVQAHGGRIWVESDAGQGTAFHFALPAVAR